MTHSTAHNRAQLESLWRRPTTAIPAPTNQTHYPITAGIRQFAQALLSFLTGEQQLRIWTKPTRQGVVWFAYDPMRDQRISHCTEDELRVWLESRHR